MRALVDADSLLYKVAFAIEEKVVWNEMEFAAGLEEEQEVDYYTDIGRCYSSFDQLISNILFATGCDDSLLIFSGEDNFRLSFPLSYKENRAPTRKPLGLYEIRDYAFNNYDCVMAFGMEADDYVVRVKADNPDAYVVCAIDKDVLYQVEGTHYNYGRDEEVTVSAFEAIRFAYFQTLTGDTSDGYKGCPSVGPVKAEKILKGLKTEYEMWQAVVTAYEARGLTEEDALWTMRLADMHQFDGNSIKLWEAPEAPE